MIVTTSYIILHKEQNIVNAIDSISQVVITISSLVTVILAFLFYDKFGIVKKILHNQVETIFTFLHELQKIKLNIQTPKNSTDNMFIFFRISDLIHNRNIYDNMANGEKLLFDL